MKTGDRGFEGRKKFDVLPEGYTIRTDRKLTSAKTTRKLTPDAQGALHEIASVTPAWTEWGFGHATSMYSGACERRGYIEVAEPEKPSQGKFLYRATRAGVKLANTWRAERGEEPLPVPRPTVEEAEHWKRDPQIIGGMPEGQDFKVIADFATDPTLDPVGARGEEWPESLGYWELHDAILAEPDAERLRTLNAELAARLG